ncbi:MAG TPA: CvpA family protein [Pseudomonadales bacterium]
MSAEVLPVNVADWVIVVIVVISTLISIKRGFVREALSLVSWVAALIVAMIFFERLAVVLAPHISMPGLRLIVAFGVLFIAALVVGAAINFLIGELVDLTGLTGTDRALGTVFGMIRGAILVLTLLILMQPVLRTDDYRWWRESALIPHFLMMEHWARETGDELATVFRRVTGQS